MGAIGIAVALAGCSASGPADDAAPGPDAAAAAAAVATQSPAAPAPPAPTIGAGAPAGTVDVQPGPFVDRVRLTELRLAGGAVTGVLDVVSDVSEVINLEVQVDFYDGAGALLGSDRAVFDTAATEEFHTTAGVVGLPFSAEVTGPRVRESEVNSAVLSIPALVNE